MNHIRILWYIDIDICKSDSINRGFLTKIDFESYGEIFTLAAPKQKTIIIKVQTKTRRTTDPVLEGRPTLERPIWL